MAKKAVSPKLTRQIVREISRPKNRLKTRCCRVLGQIRNSLYYQAKRKNEDTEIGEYLRTKAME